MDDRRFFGDNFPLDLMNTNLAASKVYGEHFIKTSFSASLIFFMSTDPKKKTVFVLHLLLVNIVTKIIMYIILMS